MVTDGIRDLEGDGLESAFTAQFTTAASAVGYEEYFVDAYLESSAHQLGDSVLVIQTVRVIDGDGTGIERALVRRYLDNPITHSVDSAESAPPDLEHHAFTVTPADKAAVVRELASGKERALLFTRTKHAAKKLAKDLTAQGIPAVDLHGNLSQPQRDRNLAAFAQLAR